MARELIITPRLRIGGAGEERHATWLELFYDLVFVVAVSQVAGRLEVRASSAAALSYAFLFIPVWWAWIGAAFYVNRFGSDDLVDRLFVLLQIAVATALAVSVGSAYSGDSAGFPLAYAGIRLILVAEYIRAGHYIPEARPVTKRYAVGFAIAAVLWAVSVLVPPPVRYGLWSLGLVVDFATPITAGQLHSQFAPHGSHLPERLGQFILIVLGAAIAAVVTGLAEYKWNVPAAGTAMLALTMAFGFWWLYFEGLDASVIRAVREEGRVAPYQIWLYAHLPLAAGLAAAGVGAEYAIRSAPDGAMYAGERWLFCAATAACFIAMAAINFARTRAGSGACTFTQVSFRLWGAAVAVVVGALGGALVPSAIVGLLAGVTVLQVIAEIRRDARPHPHPT